jgi:hypothetical protein
MFDPIRNDSRFQKLAASPIPNDAKQSCRNSEIEKTRRGYPPTAW